VQGHSPVERRTVGGKRDVAILELHPVGNYAVRIVFDDLHSTGIFSGIICSSSAKIASDIGGTISKSWQQKICRALLPPTDFQPAARSVYQSNVRTRVLMIDEQWAKKRAMVDITPKKIDPPKDD